MISHPRGYIILLMRGRSKLDYLQAQGPATFINVATCEPGSSRPEVTRTSVKHVTDTDTSRHKRLISKLSAIKKTNAMYIDMFPKRTHSKVPANIL